MNFRAFEQKYGSYPVIRSSYFSLEENPAYLRRLVSEWLAKNWLLELRRGIYLINDPLRLREVELFEIANLIYEPSYVSLESALSFYGLIPELVQQTTSISTRKTFQVSNKLGTFSYSHLKTELFWGFERTPLNAKGCLLAKPEKALLDLLYLRGGEFSDADEFMESLRLDNLARFDPATLVAYAARFAVPKLVRISAELAKRVTLSRKSK